MKEPIVPLQRSRQVGREQQRLQEPGMAFAHLGKKKLQGRVPWGRDPPADRLTGTAQATGSPALQLPREHIQNLTGFAR